jgi:Squalene-hopene cyclase C-terminal domain/Prenyltransferase and squalene oxidase repeat
VASAAEPRPTRRRRRAALIVVGVTVIVVGTALVAGAEAEKPSGRYQGTLDALVAFLQRDQNKDGGFGSEAGAASSPLFSAWVALALAAAGVNPHDQRNKTLPGAKDVYTYLAEHAGELELTTDFERELMVANTADYPPLLFGGINLVEKVLQGRIPGTGAFSHELGSSPAGMNDTIFAVLALAPIKEPAIEAVVHEAAEWVKEEQNENGSWPSTCPKSQCTHAGVEPPGDTDMTGAGLEALNAAGFHETEAQAKALRYLHEVQLPDGGWPELMGKTESNVASTAWAVQGIWAAGGNPETWVKEGNEPLGYMASLQQGDGHIKYEQSHDENGVWMTAYAGPAFAGVPLPIPYVPREVPSESKGETSAETTPTGGGKPEFERTRNEGGDGVVQGEGVDAGGGGDGAPLFSRPKPQSKGKTPGGARVVRRQKLEALDHSHSRRGANQHQPRGIEKVEPRERSEADQEVAAVNATPAGGGGGDEGSGPGVKGAPIPVKGAAKGDPGGGHEEVSGTVIGSPEGTAGKLAFGAPGLKSAGGGASDGLGAAVAIGVAALLAAGLGAGWEQRRGRLA